MTIQFLNNVNLNNNELQNVKLQSLAVAPVNPGEGQLYFNSAENRAKVFENGEWRNLTAEEAKDWTDEINTAKLEAVDKALERASADMQITAENVVYDTKMKVTYLRGEVENLKNSTVNYNEKLAEVLRIQDPTINRLIKDISQLSEDEKRAITDPVKQELENKITEKIDGLIDGASEDLNTLKELGEAVTKVGNVAEAVRDLPKKETFTLGNESSGEYTVTHTRNTEDVIVSVYDTNKYQVITDVQVVDASTVKVVVTAGTNLTGYKVVVVG